MAAFDFPQNLRRLTRWAVFAWLAVVAAAPAAQAGQTFRVLCYHDVEDDPSRSAADTISVGRLVEHFEWLKADGWTVVSIDDLLAARAGTRPLPPKAVVLTFDDGYVSFATRVLPLLEAYRYPAVFAFVTKWLETPANEPVSYGGTRVSRAAFVSPEDLRRIAASPWVEIASHSHALHRGLLANREGNELPAAIARAFDPATGTYEDDTAFATRVRTDLEASAQSLARLTGRRPRTLAWPFGRYNRDAIAAAQAAGFTVLFGLSPGVADTDRLDTIPRYYPSRDPNAVGLANLLRPESRPGAIRFATVDPAPLATAADRDATLGNLIESVRALGLNTLFLDAFSDRDGDGRPDTAFFPGTQFAVGPDYLNRLAWQTRSRGGVDTVLRVPLTATTEADLRALGRAVPFDAVLFTDFVSGRDDPARLRAALAILRHYQPEARLHLRVPATPATAGDWAAFAPAFLWPERDRDGDPLAAWSAIPAARGRLVFAFPPGEIPTTATWLARGLTHFGLDGPPPPKGTAPAAWRGLLSARVDPFASP